jgi:hypothetical protein
LLDETNQFTLLYFRELQVVVGELRKFLLHLAPGKVPSSLDFKNVHKLSWLISVFQLPAVVGNTNISSANAVPMEARDEITSQFHGFGSFSRFNPENHSGLRAVGRQTALQTATVRFFRHANCILSRPPTAGDHAGLQRKIGKVRHQSDGTAPACRRASVKGFRHTKTERCRYHTGGTFHLTLKNNGQFEAFEQNLS